MHGTPQGGAQPGGPSPGQALSTLPGAWWLGWCWWALSRHRVTVAVVWLVLTAAAGAWIWSLPDTYQAEAVVLVESHRSPERVAPATLEANLQERIQAARQRLLCSEQLLALISELNLYADQRQAGATKEALIEELRKELTIVPVDPPQRSGAGGFRVICQGRDPNVVARAANRVAVMFVEEIAGTRRSSSLAAAAFFGDQTADARRILEEREGALREFRLRYNGELPEQEEAMRAALGRLRAELQSLQQASFALESEEAGLGQALKASAKPPGSPEANLSPPAGSPPGPAPSQAEEELRKRLASLRAVYKVDHPDVQRLMAELASVEEAASERPAAGRAASEAPAPGRAASPTPGERAETLLVRLASTRGRWAALAARQTQIAAELGTLEERMVRLPLHREEFAQLARDQALSQDQYRVLAARKDSAEMAAAIERDIPPERATVLDAAPVPVAPVAPPRWLMYLIGTLGAFAIGCLLAVAREANLSALLAFPSPAPQEPAETGDAHDESGWVLGPPDTREVEGRVMRSD